MIALVPLPYNEDQGMHRTQKNVDKELQEELLVIKADTIINPWAMVVHPGYAALTNRTVMAEWRLNRLALLAVFHHYVLQVFESWVIQDDIVFVVCSHLDHRLLLAVIQLLFTLFNATESLYHLVKGLKSLPIPGQVFLLL